MKNKGFSLVESAISLALVGVLGSFTANIIGQMSRADAQSVQFNESMILTSRIADLLKDPAICEANLNGQNPALSPALAAINGAGGAAFVVTGAVIVPTNIRVSKLQLVNYFALGGGGAGIVELEIVIDQIYNGQILHQRNIPIFIDTIVNAANQIIRCQIVGSGGVNEAFCNSVGGTMVAGECTSLNAVGDFTVAGSLAATGGILARTNLNSANLTVNGPLSLPASTSATLSYSGPSAVTGGLNLTGEGRFHGMVSSGNICIGGICRNFGASGCPGGQYGYGVDAAGTLMCRPIPPPPPPPPPPPLPP